VGELFTDGLVSWADTKVQSFDEIVLEDTLRTAGSARESAIGAAEASATARQQSDTASVSSANALALAQGARREAESFAQDIKSAKEQAADAVSRLAGAEQRLADATQREASAEEKLKWLKMPRSLSNTETLVANLKPFAGTEYPMSVAQDDEAFHFVKDIDEVLHAAGWIRKQPANHNIGITYFNIFSQEFKDGVPVCVASGVSISARSKSSIEDLQLRQFRFLPKGIQMAFALRNNLASGIFPPDAHNVEEGVVDPIPSEEGPIQICVGKKP
jgi:hypothetical protein